MTIAIQVQGVLATNTGLGGWLVELFLGWCEGFPIFWFSFAIVMVTATIAFLTTSIPYAIVVPGLAFMSIAAGISPIPAFIACAMAKGYCLHIPWYSGTQLVAGPGYWDTKDFLKIGWINLIFFGLILAGACTIMVPIVFG